MAGGWQRTMNINNSKDNSMKKHIKIAVIGMAVMPVMSFALSSDLLGLQWQAQSIQQANQAAANTPDPMTDERGLKQFHDDTYPDQDINKTVLTAVQQHQATVWGLTQDDEKRYVELMQNRSGLYWKHSDMSPVEILGIDSRTTDERMHYATIYAKQLQERLAKELAWQAAADQAKKIINAGLPVVRPFDTKPFSPYSFKPIVLAPNDKLFLFTSSTLDIKRIMATLLQDLAPGKAPINTTLNIFFTGHPTATEVNTWARDQNIPVNLVSSGVITLNNDQGDLDQIKDHPALPVLVLVRNGQASKVDTSRF